MINPVSKVYSEAFFEISKQNNKLDKHKSDLLYILEVLKNHDDLKYLALNPNVSKDDKKELFSKIFVDIEKETSNLLNILIDKSRFNIFEDLTRDYKNLYNKELGILEGVVYSVNMIDESEIKDLEKSLEKKFGKKVELKNEIDKSLIGGLSIYIDGKRIDNSIKSRIDGLKAHLKKEGE